MLSKKIFIGQFRVSLSARLVDVLRHVFGFGFSNIAFLCMTVGVDFRCFLYEVPVTYLVYLDIVIRKYFQCGESLRKLYKKMNQYYVSIGIYRGLRFKLGLPCYGQRTHSNANTVRRLYLRRYS